LRFRHEKTVRLNLQFANLPYQKRLDTFDFQQQPSIDKQLIDELATGRFLHEGSNIVFLGPPGVSKTHLAIALGVLERLHVQRGAAETKKTLQAAQEAQAQPRNAYR